MKNIKFLLLILSILCTDIAKAPFESSEENLVQSYKDGNNSGLREKHASWTHWFKDRKQYQAASKAQKEIDADPYINGDKSHLREEHGSFWSHFVFGNGTWDEYQSASKAQSLIKDRQQEIQKRDPALMSKTFIENLKPYEVEALSPQQITAFSSNKIQYFTPDQIRLFSKEQLQALNSKELTEEQFDALSMDQKLDLYKQYPKNIQQMVDVLKSLEIDDRIPANYLIDLYNYSAADLVILATLLGNQPVPKALSSIMNDRFRNDPQNFPDDGVKYLILTSDIIDQLIDQSKIKFITKDQIDVYLNNDNNVKSLLLLLLIKKINPLRVPSVLQDALDNLYLTNPDLFTYVTKVYVSETAKKESRAKKEREEQERIRKAQEAEAARRAEQQRKAQAARKAEAEKKSRAQQAREEQERIRKAQEAEAAKRAEQQRQAQEEEARKRQEVKNLEKEFGITPQLKYFLESRSKLEEFLKNLKELGFEGNILDQSAWRKFYLQNAAKLHPDTTFGLPQKQRDAAEAKFKELGFINDELSAFQ